MTLQFELCLSLYERNTGLYAEDLDCLLRPLPGGLLAERVQEAVQRAQYAREEPTLTPLLRSWHSGRPLALPTEP